ncbi:oxidoreductase [Candidatus Parcubacteria bacterium]|nr:oxidoreductase [Candidatus Parcubacteria bacterium]
MIKNWQVGTLLKKEMVADNVMSLTFSLPQWQSFKAGQHYDIRLTAPGGYMAERSYSIASSPEDKGIVEYGVQLLEDGEVSPYLWKLAEGKQVEMRGPIGGHFIWDVSVPGPLILIGGGSGMVPLMSMLRHHANHLDDPPSPEGFGEAKREIVFMISARTYEHILYRRELERIGSQDRNINVVATITDNAPESWSGYKRRIDKEMLEEILGKYKNTDAKTFICGPTPFVEAVAKHMKALGFKSSDIKTERFGG